MKISLRRKLLSHGAFALAMLMAAACSATAQAQTSVQAADAVFRSNGSLAGSDWGLWSNGYIGTFIHLDTPQTVQLTVNASGTLADGAWPPPGSKGGVAKMDVKIMVPAPFSPLQ